MNTNLLRYNVIINKEGKVFVAFVPTLGISDFGKTIEECKSNVKTAIEVHIQGLIKTKSEVPEPDTADYYMSQTEIQTPSNFQFAY